MKQKSLLTLSFLLLTDMTTHAIELSKADVDLLTRICEKNQATLDTIHSFYCKYTIDTDQSKVWSNEANSGEYWREMDRSRSKKKLSTLSTLDSFFFNDRVVNLDYHRGRKEPSVVIVPRSGNTRMFHDIWRQCLMIVSHTNSPGCTLSEFARTEKERFKSIRETIVDGKQLIEIIFAHREPNGREYVFFVDPTINYLTRKFLNRDADGSDTRGQQYLEATKYREIKRGIYFPVQTRFVTMPDKDTTNKIINTIDIVTVSLQNIAVNEPIPPSTFQPNIPSGSNVLDSIEHLSYTVGRNGERLNIETNNRELPPAPAESQATPPQTATIEEPKSWTRWILPSSFSFLFLATLIHWRRKQATKKED